MWDNDHWNTYILSYHFCTYQTLLKAFRQVISWQLETHGCFTLLIITGTRATSYAARYDINYTALVKHVRFGTADVTTVYKIHCSVKCENLMRIIFWSCKAPNHNTAKTHSPDTEPRRSSPLSCFGNICPVIMLLSNYLVNNRIMDSGFTMVRWKRVAGSHGNIIDWKLRK